MSRVPRPTKSSSNLKAPGTPGRTPGKTGVVPTTPATPRLRVTSTGRARPKTPSKPAEEPETPKPKMSVREQIALRRKEVKKVETEQKKASGGLAGTFDDAIDAIPDFSKKPADDSDSLGRWGVRETIERARNNGNLNLSSRSLPCLPSCLFDIHLGLPVKPLEGVGEPEYPVDEKARKRQDRQQPSWYDAQDLSVLKARSNEIAAIQPELALFGSLKIIDLHSNRLQTLPNTLTILASLTTLDVSNNSFSEFPPALFSLPALTTLNISHNKLTGLPFAQFGCKIDISGAIDTGAFFQPEVSRSIEPLPCLHVLEAAHNQLSSSGIDSKYLPKNLRRITLSHNPLGPSEALIAALAKLMDLQEALFNHAAISDDSFKQPRSEYFPRLSVLDVSETNVTEAAIRSYFSNSSRADSISYGSATTLPATGELRIAAGKKEVKEAWEIEAERRFQGRKKGATPAKVTDGLHKAEKENWEVDAEQGLATEAGRRRARLAAAAAANDPKACKPSSQKSEKSPVQLNVVEKEPWEIDAEQGLLTDGGRRRARVQQTAKAAMQSEDGSSSPVHKPLSTGALSLSNSQYFAHNTQTLTLPASQPPSRSHARAFSMLSSPQKHRSTDDLLTPAPSLPLDTILKQEFAPTLIVLHLSNRRADPTFSFPPVSVIESARAVYGVLPRLTELCLDGCNLGDMVNVTYQAEEGGPSSSEKTNVLDIVTDTFPTLTVLDLSYNNITSDGLSQTTLERLLVPAGNGRKGLSSLKLRGNRLSTLDSFEHVAERFRRNQHVEGWRLEELDVRDNEIAKLPSSLGLIPMDVFLVDGNTFRIPPRRVWEKEGTKGLLSWLRGRLE